TLPPTVTVRASKSTVTSTSPDSSCFQISSISSCSINPVNMPALPELPRKISAKREENTALNPQSPKAQTACSREEPEPKPAPAKSTVPLLKGSWFSTKFSSLRQLENRPS